MCVHITHECITRNRYDAAHAFLELTATLELADGLADGSGAGEETAGSDVDAAGEKSGWLRVFTGHL